MLIRPEAARNRIIYVVVSPLVAVSREREIKLGLDLKGGRISFSIAKGRGKSGERDILAVCSVLRNRIDQYGVAVPVIHAKERSCDHRSPSVQDPEGALECRKDSPS
jgi:preprotein translocase subunit SecD